MTGRRVRSSVIENASPQYFRNFADRPIVATPCQFPFRAVGQVVVELGDGRRHYGIGTLLSDYTVLTAGHIIKKPDNTFKDIAKMYFVPAAQHLSRPYGIFDWRFVRALRSGARDWALISLAEPAGHSVGFLGTYTDLSHEKWVGRAGFSFFGQTLELQDRMDVVEDVQIVAGADLGRLMTDQDIIRSQTGAPLIRNWQSNNPQVIAIYVGGRDAVHCSSEFLPGWDLGQDDAWLTWLCDEFGNWERRDRFRSYRSRLEVETVAMQPDYSPFSYAALDDGPAVRFSCAPNRRAQALRACMMQG